MATLVASAVCEPAIRSGQDNRAGQNFKFINLPSNGSTQITATIHNAFMYDANGDEVPAGDVASLALWENNATLWHDSKLVSLSSGDTFSASKVNAGSDYYLGNPSAGSSGKLIYNFVVTFSY